MYVEQLHSKIDASPLTDPSTRAYQALKAAIIAAEDTGLDPSRFPPNLVKYLDSALAASEQGYAVAFVAVAVLAGCGALIARMVRKPDHPTDTHPPEPIPEVPL